MTTAITEERLAGGHDACGVAADRRIGPEDHQPLGAAALRWAGVAAASVLGFYFLVLSLLNSPGHAVSEIVRIWYWMLPLVGGFALQMGLFRYARGASRLGGTDGVSGKGVALSGGATTASMVACCAHHLADLLPLVGLAGAAFFFNEYLDLFLLTGVLSNLVGFAYLAGRMRRHRLYPASGSLLTRLFSIPFDVLWPWIAAASGAFWLLVLWIGYL